jgi:archaellum biogenesis protein FlaJ (TadC family)
MVKPRASYILTEEEFEKFVRCFESMKTSTGYSSDLEKYIQKKNFGGLKSHDYHVLI